MKDTNDDKPMKMALTYNEANIIDNLRLFEVSHPDTEFDTLVVSSDVNKIVENLGNNKDIVDDPELMEIMRTTTAFELLMVRDIRKAQDIFKETEERLTGDGREFYVSYEDQREGDMEPVGNMDELCSGVSDKVRTILSNKDDDINIIYVHLIPESHKEKDGVSDAEN